MNSGFAIEVSHPELREPFAAKARELNCRIDLEMPTYAYL